jgi:hypothetical protein
MKLTDEAVIITGGRQAQVRLLLMYMFLVCPAVGLSII